MGVQQYGVDFDAKPYQHKGRGQPYSLEVVNFLIEHIGVIRAAAAHENKTQSDKGDADEHEHVVPSLENEFPFRLLICFCTVFFGHTAKVVKS